MPRNDKKHNISLTKKQYLSLIKIAWLGNWIANGQRDGSPANPHIDEYDDIHSHILSFAKEFEFGHYVGDKEAGDDRLYETLQFDDDFDLYELTREYDERSFVDELVNQLAERDFHREYNRAAIRAMSREDHATKLDGFIEKWAEEINKNGLDNIAIDKVQDRSARNG